MPHFTSDNDIERIGSGLIDRSLPKSDWTHAGHFAAALWIIAKCPHLDAARDMPGLIRTYNEATGVANTDASGYHETITQASLRAARAFLAAAPPAPLFEVCNNLMSSPLGQPDWLLTYWTRETLFSTAARRTYTPPNKRSLPF
jgi:hypothetical protein